jgi:hypothetical protein
MKRRFLCIILVCISAVGVGLLGDIVHAQQDVLQNVSRMTKEDLKPLVGDPNVMVIDVRAAGDWDKDALMIQGAVREDPMQVPSWMDRYPKDKTLVFYCA